MARRSYNIDERTTVELFVNGEQAEQAMARLKERVDKLSKSIADAQAAGNWKEAKKLQKELDAIKNEMKMVDNAGRGVAIVLNNLSNSSLAGLRNSLKYLKRQLAASKPNSDDWDRYKDQIQQVTERIRELESELEKTGSLWDRFRGWAQKTWSALDLIKGYGGDFISFAREYVDAFASMDQEMANVRKFTGMTEEDVASLNEEFKNMDTRTSREDLNKLAQEAGRLGKTSKEEVLGFVKAANQINVALDDIGEGATLALSKLTGIFGVEADYGTEQSLLKVGSVINELSQNCSASSSYLTQFASRMGGVGAQAGLTIPQIMAFGAVLDSNGQQVEAASTALSQVIVRMMQEPAKYAQVAGLDVRKFTEMLKTDVNGALVLFLETLQQAGGMDTLSPMFKDMGENGSRAIAALSTLATHIDEVKSQQIEANKAFEEGISVTEEYEVQNGTVEAALEKVKNAANDLRVELGQYLYPIMRKTLEAGASITGMLIQVIKFVVEHRAAIAALTFAVGAYLLVLNKELIIKKARNILDSIHYGYLVLEAKATTALSIVTEALRLVYYRLTGQTVKATAAQEALKVAMAATPWGAILAAISAAIVALKLFGNQAEKTAINLDTLKRGEAEANAKLAEEKALLQQNINTLENFNGTKEQEAILVNKLNEKYGSFFGTCKTVKGWYETLTRSGNDYTNAIYQQILMEAKRQQALDLIKQAQEAREAGRNGEGITNGDQLMEFIDNLKYLPTWDHLSWDEAYSSVYRKNKAALDRRAEELETRAHQLLEEYTSDVANATPFESNAPTPSPSTAPSPSTMSGGGSRDRFEIEKKARERAEAVARLSYVKGESDYEKYTSQMDEIAVKYFSMLLERTDLSKDERLSIQAQYWEAVNKQTQHATEALIKEENSAYSTIVSNLKNSYLEQLSVSNLSAEERERIEKAHQESIELAELEHLRKLRDMAREGTEERQKAEDAYLSARIKAAQRHQAEYEKTQKEHADKLAAMKEKYFGPNAGENDEAFKSAMAALTEVYNAELVAAGENEAEILRIKEAYMAAELTLRKQYNQEGADDAKSAYSAAIQSSLEWLQSDGGKALTGTLSTLVSGMSSIFSGLSTLVQAELDIQTAKIEKRYDREIELAQGNSYRVAKLEKKKEAEIAKAKNEANRKMFAMQVIQAVAQTAQNALSAYGSAAAIPVVGYILAPIAAAMAVAAGAIQIAAIKKQQQAAEVQGYSQGGFTRRGRVDEPAGIVHAGEWVASQKLLASPVARPMIEALDYAQRTNTIGSLRAADVSRAITANNSLVRIAESNDGSALMAAVSARMALAVDNLTNRLNEPFVTVNTVTGDRGIKQAQDDYEKLLNNITPKSKRKK